jgi:uncharacterized membrane protein YfcA
MSILAGLHWPEVSGGVWALGMLAFLLGGLVKGTLGVGLHLVVVPLMSLAVPSPLAISLVVVPVLASNLWQAWDSKAPMENVRRFSPLLMALFVATVITVPMTLALSVKSLNVMLAVAVITAVLLMALNPKLNVSPRHEKVYSLAVGALSGVMGGISSLTGPIMITYLMALRLSRESFVGTMSVIYLCGSIPLYIAMALVGRLGLGEFLLSGLAMVPVMMGMAVGKRLRVHLSELLFRRTLLVFLSLIALALLLK